MDFLEIYDIYKALNKSLVNFLNEILNFNSNTHHLGSTKCNGDWIIGCYHGLELVLDGHGA